MNMFPCSHISYDKEILYKISLCGYTTLKHGPSLQGDGGQAKRESKPRTMKDAGKNRI